MNDKIQSVASNFKAKDNIFYGDSPDVFSFKSNVLDYVSGYVV